MPGPSLHCLLSTYHAIRLASLEARKVFFSIVTPSSPKTAPSFVVLMKQSKAKNLKHLQGGNEYDKHKNS
jgi:hypothetical protein